MLYKDVYHPIVVRGYDSSSARHIASRFIHHFLCFRSTFELHWNFDWVFADFEGLLSSLESIPSQVIGITLVPADLCGQLRGHHLQVTFRLQTHSIGYIKLFI